MFLFLSLIPGIVGWLADRSTQVYDLFNNGYSKLRDYWNFLHFKVAAFFAFLNPAMLLTLVNYAFQLINLASSLYNSLSEYVYNLSGSVREIIFVLLPAIRTIVVSMFQRITTLIYVLFDRLFNLAVSAFDRLMNIVFNLWGNLVTLVLNVFTQIMQLVTSLFVQLISLSTQMFSQLAVLSNIYYTRIIDFFSRMFEPVTSFFSGTIFKQLSGIARYAGNIIDLFGSKYQQLLWILSSGFNALLWVVGNFNNLVLLIGGQLFPILVSFLTNPAEFIKQHVKAAYGDIRAWLVGEIIQIFKEALEKVW